MGQSIFSVAQINRYLRNILEEDVILSDVSIRGEISNVKYHSSGHIYFTLKDNDASINCVMFKTYTNSLTFNLSYGLKIVVNGYISFYEKTGQMQLYTEKIAADGVGTLYQAFKDLEKKLSTEGLFDDKYKKELPSLPEKIAIITSPTGSVIQDIINITKRRNKLVQLVLIPVRVQGDGAYKEIVTAIEDANNFIDVDTIILARGGGSLEDLWNFNSEELCQAIFKSKAPIISAIGHETDFTLADFVSDLRAPTPSAAAELAVPKLEDLQNDVTSLWFNLTEIMQEIIEDNKNKLNTLLNNKYLANPLTNIYDRQIALELLTNRLDYEINQILTKSRLTLENKYSILRGVSPQNILKLGYAIIRDSNNNVISSITNVKQGDEISIEFKDGKALAEAKGRLLSIDEKET